MATFRDLMHEFRIDYASDKYGTTMHWWFTVADHIHFELGEFVPDHWDYTPGIASQNYDDTAADMCGQTCFGTLERFGNFLCRLARRLDRAGLSY